MKILVIGSSGFIGKIYKSNSTLKERCYFTSSRKRKGFIKFDILKDDIIKKVIKLKISHVIILAAISNPNECVTNKRRSRKINVTYTKKLIKSLINKNIYFIFFSSEYVFSGKKGFYSEKDIPKPISYYGKQKYEIELFINKTQYNKCAIFRIAKTYGNNINDGTLFSNFLYKYKIKNIREFNIASDQKFNALYALDLVKIIDHFCKNSINGTYNIGGDYQMSRHEFISKFIKNLELKNIILNKSKLSNFNSNDKLPLNVSMNNIKLKKIIPFTLSKLEDSFTKLKKLK